VQMLLSCQMALGVISRRYLRGGTRRVVLRHLCFWRVLGQSAQAEQKCFKARWLYRRLKGSGSLPWSPGCQCEKSRAVRFYYDLDNESVRPGRQTQALLQERKLASEANTFTEQRRATLSKSSRAPKPNLHCCQVLFERFSIFVLVELAWDNAGKRTGSSNHQKHITQVLV